MSGIKFAVPQKTVELLKPTEPVMTLSKLEVATRQFAQAAWLFFSDADPVSIHTLASASAQIFHDLCDQKGIDSSFALMLDHVKPEYQKQFVDVIRRPQNFFKHASSDADTTLSLHPDAPLQHLFLSHWSYKNLTGRILWEGFLCEYHMMVRHPELSKDPEHPGFKALARIIGGLNKAGIARFILLGDLLQPELKKQFDFGFPLPKGDFIRATVPPEWLDPHTGVMRLQNGDPVFIEDVP